MKSALPTERAARAARIAELRYDYAATPKRDVARCNLCGHTRLAVIAHRDRYGYPAEARGCLACGLVFLAPVMTEDAYADFYQRRYRPLVSAYHGRLIDASTIQDEQRQYAAERLQFVAPFVGSSSRSLLDIGGSTGVVAQAFAQAFGLQGTVIDPAPLEIAEAKRLGLETITGFVERHELGDRRFDLVIMCQTVDHLLDIASTLSAVRGVLTDGGVFFVDIVDFRAAVLRHWSVEEAIKIDHPYYLTDETMRAYLARAGFDVQRIDYAADHLHVGYLCTPAAATRPMSPASEAVDGFFRELRFVQNAPAGR